MGEAMRRTYQAVLSILKCRFAAPNMATRKPTPNLAKWRRFWRRRWEEGAILEEEIVVVFKAPHVNAPPLRHTLGLQ